MIDRDKILKISQDFYLNKVFNRDCARELVEEYCKEFGKSEEDIYKLLNIFTRDSFVLSELFRDALEYYEKKFHIVKLFGFNQASLQGVSILLIF